MAKSKGTNNDVGYRKPPRHTQFRPGQSGNPKGRPKKIPTLAEEVARELCSFVTVVEDGKRLSMTKSRAIAKQHVAKAARGDNKSTALIMDLIKQQPPDEQKNGLHLLLQEFREKNSRYVSAELRTQVADGKPTDRQMSSASSDTEEGDASI